MRSTEGALQLACGTLHMKLKRGCLLMEVPLQEHSAITAILWKWGFQLMPVQPNVSTILNRY